MRLKLVLISSLIAAIVGAGSTTLIILLVFVRPITTPGLLALSTYLLPVASILLAAIFVYRHTARRRRLQAVLTALISLLLTVGIFLLVSILTAPDQIKFPPPTDAPRNVG